MSSKYLYEKIYDKEVKKRILFKSAEELFNFLMSTGELNFNAGFGSAEIRLNRVEEK